MRLTLRTLLAYADDLLDVEDAQEIGKRIEQSEFATELSHRRRDLIRRLGIGAPDVLGEGLGRDANTVAEYLDNTLSPEQVADFERMCLESDVHLAEVAVTHQILSLVLKSPADVDSLSRARCYALPTSVVNKKTAHRDAALPELAELGTEEPPVDIPRRDRSRNDVPEFLQKRSHWPTRVVLLTVFVALPAALYWYAGPTPRRSGRTEMSNERFGSDFDEATPIGSLPPELDPSTPNPAPATIAAVPEVGVPVDQQVGSASPEWSWEVTSPLDDDTTPSSGLESLASVVESLTAANGAPPPSDHGGSPAWNDIESDTIVTNGSIQETPWEIDDAHGAAAEIPAAAEWPSEAEEHEEHIDAPNGEKFAAVSRYDGEALEGSHPWESTSIVERTETDYDAEPDDLDGVPAPPEPVIGPPAVPGVPNRPRGGASTVTADTDPAGPLVGLREPTVWESEKESPAHDESLPESPFPEVASTVATAQPTSAPNATASELAADVEFSETGTQNSVIPCRVVSGNASLLLLDPATSHWSLATAETDLRAGDRLFVPPATTADLAWENFGQITIAGPGLAVLGAADASGLSLLDLLEGRAWISSRGATSHDFSIKAGNELVRLKSCSDDWKIAIQSRWSTNDPAREPDTTWEGGLYVERGALELTLDSGGDRASIVDGCLVRLTGLGSRVESVAAAPSWVANPEMNQAEKRTQYVLWKAASRNGPVELSFEALARSPQPRDAAAAIISLAWMGRLDLAVASLQDVKLRSAWDGSIDVLGSTLARGEDAQGAVREAVSRQFDSETEMALRMLRGFTLDEFQQGGASLLVAGLDHKMLGIRVLSFHNLRSLTGAGAYYRPEMGPTQRRGKIATWRQWLKDGQIFKKAQANAKNTGTAEDHDAFHVAEAERFAEIK